jgi:hypothetical protein
METGRRHVSRARTIRTAESRLCDTSSSEHASNFDTPRDKDGVVCCARGLRPRPLCTHLPRNPSGWPQPARKRMAKAVLMEAFGIPGISQHAGTVAYRKLFHDAAFPLLNAVTQQKNSPKQQAVRVPDNFATCICHLNKSPRRQRRRRKQERGKGFV